MLVQDVECQTVFKISHGNTGTMDQQILSRVQYRVRAQHVESALNLRNINTISDPGGWPLHDCNWGPGQIKKIRYV